ncbi:hypothetical protein DNU06_17230 [Putridiphycobacter roseus]|uniref:Outer membrane protein beta-barrel domain-containing protein n=1 Tax=Putridiphycobacter roseus TaxID=2219161 RepID=A0A2W1MYG9_9FLAO|nr:hypothetical protein [Putridiphycobacter roseus]PZE15601.1 hypothetical protein DNU06_17230 [Putridiphycobacter roseus]
MKTRLLIISLCFGSYTYSQDVNKNFLGLQFGGQSIVGFSYDRTILHQGKLLLNGAAGIVLNEYADDQDPLDRPIYGLNLGMIALFDFKYVFIESAIYASPYFYKSFTFINYYAWLGLRVSSKKISGGFASVGWTPSLHFSKNPPNHYNKVQIGIKAGFNF